MINYNTDVEYTCDPSYTKKQVILFDHVLTMVFDMISACVH